MAKAQLSKRQHRTSPRRVLGAAVALIVVFLLLASVVGLAEKYLAIRNRLKDMKSQQAALALKQAQLRETNSYIETKEGQERELREKYNIVKPGEGMIVITEPEAAAGLGGPTTRVGRWWDSLLRGLGVRED